MTRGGPVRLDGHPRYELPRGSALYPARIEGEVPRPPHTIYVAGDPLALDGSVLLESAGSPQAARKAGELVADEGLTLVVTRGRDWRLDGVEGAVSRGGRVLVWGAVWPDEGTVRHSRVDKALSQVLALGGALASSHSWKTLCACRDQSGRSLALAAATSRASCAAEDVVSLMDSLGDGLAGQSPLRDFLGLALDVELSYRRVDRAEDPMAALAAHLMAGELAWQPSRGTVLTLTWPEGLRGTCEVVCRDKVSAPELGGCRGPEDAATLGLDVGTAMIELESRSTVELAETLNSLPRRAFCGAIASVLESPGTWLSVGDPARLCERLGVEPVIAAPSNEPLLPSTEKGAAGTCPKFAARGTDERHASAR